jgi:tetratricopeptide (TPR) repeat protein
MKRKTVSLCMIARDEEACIGRAIKSVLALVDEILVVDTGSRDNTRIIAEGYGARILDHTWRDDFSAARNVALAAATCDWILVLDADEYLHGIRPLEFQRLLCEPAAAAYRVRVTGQQVFDRAGHFPAIRLFRNLPDIRYRYPVHEQILPDLLRQAETSGLSVCDSPLRVIHDPGGADAMSRKRDRNLRLLRQAAQAQPQEPYFAYLLGSESLVWLDGEALPVAGLRTSLQHLQDAWRTVRAWPVATRRQLLYGPSLAADLAASLLAVGQADTAAHVVATARQCWGDGVRLCLQAVRAGLERLAAEEDPVQREILGATIRADLQAAAACLEREDPVRGAALRAQSLRLQGDLALVEGEIPSAAEAYEQALSSDQDHAAAWVGLAECARLAKDRKRALRLYLRAITASEWSVRAWERGCSLLEELGFHDNAQSWRTRVRDQFPERGGRRFGTVTTPQM